jgi:hypothetical protein
LSVTDIHPDELVPDSRAAAVLHLSPGTLATWRSKRRGPPYVKIGRRIFYRMQDLNRFIGAQWREPKAKGAA